MRVLVLGASGMLGTDLLQEWKSDELVPARSADADIRDLAQVQSLLARVRPDWVVLAAGYTDVDGSERNPDLAFSTNAQGAENVSCAAQAHSAKLLFISTDYVFDGRSSRPYEPEDPTAPLNVYGLSKAAAEHAVHKFHENWCVVRTSWLFGTAGPSFPEKILRASESRPELKVVNDQVGCPTFTRDLAVAIRKLVHMDARGTVHVTNAGSCSWYEFALEILRQAGRAGTVPISPISSAAAARPAKRPAFSVLSSASSYAKGISLRHWRGALGAYLSELSSKGELR